jgi:hypothetical protein
MREGAAAAGHEPAANDEKHGTSERLPLKTVLQNFLNHVETLESQRSDADNTYEKEFQVSPLLPGILDQVCMCTVPVTLWHRH